MVKEYSKMLLVSMGLLAVVGCSRRTTPVPPVPIECPRQDNAIQVYLEASRQLNLYRERPHTCLVCIYQLENPNSFDQLKQDEKGLSTLLECSRFDGSVTNARREVLQPGEEKRLAFARAEGTKYVGVVAGYYSLESKKVTRLFQIPVIEEKKGIIRRKKSYRCGTLNIDLYLGSHSIQKMERK